MAGPSHPVPTAGLPDSTALGRAPRDGDFARLLEAASAPAAHRLQAAAAEAGRAARATRFGGAPPQQADGPPPHEDTPAAAPGAGATRFGGRPPAPIGPPGMAAGRTEPLEPAEQPPSAADAPTAAAGPAMPSAGPADLAALAGRALGAWSGRPPKDRLVIALLAIGAAWMLLTIVATALTRSADEVGTLVVLALVAYFVLGGWRRGRRKRDADR
ncbi:MAG: hypothetical protein RJA99_1136 [Pseudomonadota bacterium]|jgi:hypothetical protein